MLYSGNDIDCIGRTDAGMEDGPFTYRGMIGVQTKRLL